jgi:hypothetical protein
MKNRTWTLNLMATPDHPATTLAGIPQDEATRILHGLIHGPRSPEYAYVEDAVREHAVRERSAPERVAA